MHRIQLSNTEFEGENNVFVLGTDTGPLTLIDTGVATTSVCRDLERRFNSFGYSFEDIDQILLTHWHADHAGLAGYLQGESGASVHVDRSDAGLVDGSEVEEFRRLREDCFLDWGIPKDPRGELLDFLNRHSDRSGEPPEVSSFSAGNTFYIDDRSLEVVHLPGHTAGSVAFVDRDRNEAFCGDALLPKYTPNIGGADVRVDDPLSTYIESLTDLVEANLHRAFPGHRNDITDPTARARTIIAHHRERTERVFSIVQRRGPIDPWTVSAELFGSLERIHIMHGPGEAASHLEHLERKGVIKVEGNKYETEYNWKARIEPILAEMENKLE